ncbi:MAG: hypothetical protein FWC73_01695 [Defluviitaleaceae bacterium]|nr:hypothetical protein [Defluviitaleaceae bacterium]
MSNEKIRVLDMLDAGKITADEAARLLEALKGPGFMNKETRENVEDKLRHFGQECGRLAREAGAKLQVMYKEVEPKVKKASQAALEKAACVLEDLACAINKSLDKEECCGEEECCCKPEQAECCGNEEPRAN